MWNVGRAVSMGNSMSFQQPQKVYVVTFLNDPKLSRIFTGSNDVASQECLTISLMGNLCFVIKCTTKTVGVKF